MTTNPFHIIRGRRNDIRPVTDPDEGAQVRAEVETSVLDHYKWLRAEELLHVRFRLRQSLTGHARLAVADRPNLQPRFGARSGIVLVRSKRAQLPGFTHDQFAGELLHNWQHLLPRFGPRDVPTWAYGTVTVPDTVDELLAQLDANTTKVDHSTFEVTGDVVIPTAFGARSATYLVPRGVKVRALANSAGHNEFQRV